MSMRRFLFLFGVCAALAIGWPGGKHVAMARPSDHLSISTVPDASAGDTFTGTLTALDAKNNTDSAFASTVSLSNLAASVVANGQTAFSAGGAPTPAVAGTATFSGLRIDNAADGYTFTATASGALSGTSNAFAATFRTLSVGAVADTRSGSPFSVSVTARDNNGNSAENFGSGTSDGSDLALMNLAAAAVANGQTAFDAAVAPTFSSGVATFSGLGISNAADGYTFRAS